MRIANIINELEQFARPSLQASWDNTGLQLGSPAADCTGVLVCLDPTPAIVEEAAAKGCNLIVAHHPLFFKPVKRLTGATSVEVTAMNAIAAGISIYSSHTAADNTLGGVSYTMAQLLGVDPKCALDAVKGDLVELTVMVPADRLKEVQYALFDCGAGAIGNYDCCSFSVKGQGTFRPLDGAAPAIGEVGLHSVVDEVALHMVMPAELMSKVEKTLLQVHPYETPAYQFTAMLNQQHNLGTGIYGIADEERTPSQLIEHVKKTFGCTAVRTTKVDWPDDFKIRRVAMCGGSGGEYIARAIAMGAQAYITADVRYHDFVDFRDKILVIDAGHYNTEAPIKQVFANVISSKFPDLKVGCTASDDNPINYV